MIRGGVKGGTAVLTEFGVQLLRAWDKFRSEVIVQMEKSYKKHVREVLKIKNN
jgi:molybdenum-dependent DNA-binding transcriptional regulator ModE